MDFPARVETVFQHRVHRLDVVQGCVSIGEPGPQPVPFVEAAEQRVPFLGFLTEPMVQVLGLEFRRTAADVGIRDT